MACDNSSPIGRTARPTLPTTPARRQRDCALRGACRYSSLARRSDCDIPLATALLFSANCALRATRLDAMRRGAPPREWAAFTLVGDPLVTIPLRQPARLTVARLRR